MYSPRIREALIPRVYRAASATGIPMTAWVNRAIEEALQEHERRIESEVADASVDDGAKQSGKEWIDGIGRIPKTD